MAKFDDFINEVKSEVKSLAIKLFHEYQDTAVKESVAFLNQTRSDLERWLKLMITGDLTREEFEWLVAGKKDLLDLFALKEAGLARVRIDKFRNGLLKIIVDKAVAILV
jgi:hypothetical protein